MSKLHVILEIGITKGAWLILRLNVIYYGPHTPEVDRVIIRAKPQYAVINPPHGLYGEMRGYDNPWLLQNLADYHAAGIKLIGYLTAGYEGIQSGGQLDRSWFTIETVRKLVRNMAELDRIDGIFLDEISAYPDRFSKEYMKEVNSFAHNLGLLTWGNVGIDWFDPWLLNEGGLDLIHCTEHWQGGNINPLQKEWGKRISVSGFARHYTSKNAVKLTREAWKKGLAFCYINNTEYMSLAPWFAEYADMLAAS